MKRLIVDLDEKVHHEFKMYCYNQKKTIKQVIVSLIAKEMKRKGGESTKKGT